MLKRLAAAVLAAIVNLGGLPDTDATDIDVGEGDGIECLEVRRTGQSAEQPPLLAVASRECGERIESAWIVYEDQRPCAAVAVQQIATHVAGVSVSANL